MASPRTKPPIHPVPTLDWPTLWIAIAIYGGWFVATRWHAALPDPVLMAVGGWLLAWHGSLQHETIHGHPTGVQVVDRALGFAPLSLWLPYALYRRSHVAHHGCRTITDPHADPESRYAHRTGGPAWLAARAQSTLIGHMLLGPPIAVVHFLILEIRRFFAEPVQAARDWLPHILATALLLFWLDHVGLSLWRYVLYFVYPGMALTTVRSHAEHGPDLATAGRAATVERGGLFALLFLNNNLHAAHHEQPQLAWYRLPAWHRRNRARLILEGATLYAGYGEIVRRFIWRGRDAPLHPHYRPDAA